MFNCLVSVHGFCDVCAGVLPLCMLFVNTE